MRVVFDGYWWDRGPAGSRAVQQELIRAWREVFPADQLAVALRSDAHARDLPAGIDRLYTRLWPHALTNMVELSRIAKRWKADLTVAHSFSPLRDGGITVIDDASFLEHPEWFPLRQRLYFAAMLPSARFASVVATCTESEAARLERHSWRLAPVTALGAAPPTAAIRAEPRKPSIAEGLEGFALVSGKLRGRANVEGVLRSLRHSTRITPTSPLLVATGTSERKISARLSLAAKHLREAGLVRFVGQLDAEGLSWLYRHAAVAIALAHDDSSALPALEATWFDTPLVASDIPAHRETVSGWARFVPADIRGRELAQAVDETWNAPGDEQARDRILARSNWHHAVRALRAAAPAA